MATKKDYDNLNNANRRLASLLALKPQKGKDGKSFYEFEGKQFTKFALDKEIKNQEYEVQKFRDVIASPAETEANKEALRGQARQQAEKLSTDILKITRARKDFEMASSRAATPQEREILDRWVLVYQNKEQEFTAAIERLASDVPLATPPSMPQILTPDKAKTMPIQEPPVPTRTAPIPTTATVTQGVLGQRVVTPGPGVAAPTQTPTTPATPTATGMSRMPSLDQINVARRANNQPELALRNGKFVEVGTGKEVTPEEAAASTGQTTTGTSTVPGGGPAGVTPGGTPGGAVPPATTTAAPNLINTAPADWQQAAQELYPAYFAMIKDDPEIAAFLERYIKEEWDDLKFQAERRKLRWWNETNANARDWQEQKLTDPATAKQKLDNRSALIRDYAAKLGVTLPPDTLAKLAEDSIVLGLTLQSQFEEIIGNAAVQEFGTMSQLRFGFIGQSLRETAGQYGVALSDISFNEWVDKIAKKQESLDTFEAYANQTARVLYPSLASGFDRGLSFKSMTDPYAAQASRILEIPTSEVDFTDPRWARAFTSRNAQGEQQQMSYGEWADYLRSDPSFGWEYTDQAKSQAYDIALEIGRMFGRAG